MKFAACGALFAASALILIQAGFFPHTLANLLIRLTAPRPGDNFLMEEEKR